MQKQNFKKIMQLEIDVTNKLLSYMHSKIDLMEIFKNLDIDFLHDKDEKSSLAFNIWLSVDYIDKDGKNFVEKMLEDKSISLTNVERQILQEKAKSFVSLYEIISFENHFVVLKDILDNREYHVLEPNIHNLIETGEFLFTRIGNVLDNNIFMGDINYVPSLVKDYFLEELLIDYNLIRKDQKNLSMVEYLKRYSLNLYKIYNETLIDVIDSDGDINTLVFDELDEFEEFLLSKYKDIAVKKQLNNLTNIFDYALADNDMTLYDICNLDLENFFSEAIKDGFINSQEEFNSYITTIKNYLQFLSIGDPQYKDSYKNILMISKDRFKYMIKLDTNNSFNLDRDLASLITFMLNDQAISILMDYDKFILYISDTNIKLTSTKKHIKRKDLLQLNKLFDNEITFEKKAPNQEDFHLINLFFYASLNSKILEIRGNDLLITNKGFSLLRLSDEEKYVILVQYLLSKEFIKDVFNSQTYIVEKSQDNIISELSKLKAEKLYIPDEFPLNRSIIFHNYFKYLLGFGLIKFNPEPILIGITNLGKKIFNYITEKKDMVKDTQIIRLDDFKRTKKNMEG